MYWLGLSFYATVWPGIDPTPFAEKPTPIATDAKRFAGGMVRFLCGTLALLVVAGFNNRLDQDLAEWIAIFAILTAIHLGFSDMLSDLAKTAGWKVKPLFDAPYRSKTLSEFWTRRWNRPFVELDRIFFLPWLTKTFGIKGAVFAIFLISGLLHEFAISFPAGAGYGLPLLYFAVQGILMFVERRFKIKHPLWVIAAILGPLPILFHGPFRHAVIGPLLVWLRTTMLNIGAEQALSILIYVLAIAQILILAASFQVPTRLKWKEELPRLSSLNHKLMWTYGSFIVFTIVSWGVLTLVLHRDILHGTPAGLAISTVIFLFWGFRLGVDSFYFKSSDWPSGPFLQIGHVMLNCLFTLVFFGYGAIIGWHLLR